MTKTLVFSFFILVAPLISHAQDSACVRACKLACAEQTDWPEGKCNGYCSSPQRCQEAYTKGFHRAVREEAGNGRDSQNDCMSRGGVPGYDGRCIR